MGWACNRQKPCSCFLKIDNVGGYMSQLQPSPAHLLWHCRFHTICPLLRSALTAAWLTVVCDVAAVGLMCTRTAATAAIGSPSQALSQRHDENGGTCFSALLPIVIQDQRISVYNMSLQLHRHIMRCNKHQGCGQRSYD